jgi:hypothetical protein
MVLRRRWTWRASRSPAPTGPSLPRGIWMPGWCARPGGQLHRRPDRAAGQRSFQAKHPIDDVLYQPLGVEAVAAEVLGEELDDRTPTGLWPSDHAGVVAKLHLAYP